MDNKSGKIIPGRKALMRELSLFSEEDDKPKVSPQLQLAILQYLNTGEQLLYSYFDYNKRVLFQKIFIPQLLRYVQKCTQRVATLPHDWHHKVSSPIKVHQNIQSFVQYKVI